MTTKKTSSSRAPAIVGFQRQLLELQKSAFDSSFEVVDRFQKQQEDMLRSLLKQMPGVPDDAEDAIESWTKIFRESRRQYFEAAQKGFELYGRMIERAGQASADPDASDGDAS